MIAITSAKVISISKQANKSMTNFFIELYGFNYVF